MTVEFDGNYWKSSTSAGVMKLTSRNQDINDVLSHILYDIVFGIREGVDGIDPYGRKVIRFLEIIANLGDYPATSGCGYLMGNASENTALYEASVVIKEQQTGNRFTLPTFTAECYRSSFLMNGWI